jgi:2-oxoglutarate ferredoxin oxidoreductase subunit delta
MTDAGNKEAVRAWRYPPQSEHPDADVFVYRPWCKACGICYELCPAKVLESDKAGYPVVSDPQACTACYLCEAMCPEMAITVYKERGPRTGGAAAASEGSGGREREPGGVKGSEDPGGGDG